MSDLLYCSVAVNFACQMFLMLSCCLVQLWDTRLEAAATELGFINHDLREGLARVCI